MTEHWLREGVRYPNVTTQRWAKMCDESTALLKEADYFSACGDKSSAEMIWKQLRPLNRHIQAITHLLPRLPDPGTKGPTDDK